jgi:alpha-galactosidase
VAAKFIKMNGEDEDYTAYGDTLMYAGVKLKSAFGATGYNDEVRFYQDFGARMYFMEAENADSEH